MKVNERKSVPDPRVGGAGGVAPGGSVPEGTGAGADDQVSVSETARELARLKGEVGDVEGVRADRVASLRNATTDRRYVPDARGAATGLVREVLGDLLA
jgi:anti-sigma28 factor (negative regulator of flagellin synthesis)